MRYLLDTNICIYTIKQRPPQVAARLETVRAGEAAISSITAYELWHGVARSKRIRQNSAALGEFLADLAVLEFDATDAQAGGELRATLEKRGTPIGAYDLLIAAQARVRKLTLVTHNAREFRQVPGLRVEDWAADK